MSWLILFIAGLFEIVWATALKASEGFSKLLPSVIALLGTVASFILLSLAIKNLPLGTAYAIWTGIGVIGTVLIGIFFWSEPITLLKAIFLTMLLVGILGLEIVK
ncbi:MAG: multidrug efflux SMR transporter [Clostridia bacterium]|nr:multidrug efflux SMR transporter [Clostridia bacterium]